MIRRKIELILMLGCLMILPGCNGCGEENAPTETPVSQNIEEVESPATVAVGGTEEKGTETPVESEKPVESVVPTTAPTESPVVSEEPKESVVPVESEKPVETAKPSTKPTAEPTSKPTPKPTSKPTPAPTSAPTSAPVTTPTPVPQVHTHNYTTQVKIAATCESPKVVHDVCSCGSAINERTEGAALGHNVVREWMFAETCTSPGYWYDVCSRCRAELASGKGTALGHDFVQTGIRNPDRNCKTPAIVDYKCSRCTSTKYEYDWYNCGPHVYKDFINRDFDYINDCWVETPVVACQTCGKHPDE